MSEWTAERIAELRYNMQVTRSAVYTGWEMFHALDEIERCHAALSTTTEQLVALSRIHQADKARIAELEAAEVELSVTRRALELACCTDHPFTELVEDGTYRRLTTAEVMDYYMRQAEQS